MANLKAIRKRIASVKNTQKITRAMKLVAAARLRRAQQNITEMRPYAIKTMEVLSSVAAREDANEAAHPLLERREPKSVMLVVLTSDRGLAGAFNSSICKASFLKWKELEAEGKKVSFTVIGRKGREFLARRGANIVQDFTGIFESLSMEKAAEIGRYVVDFYTRETEPLDACYLVYNEFKSAISQEVKIETLLPVTPHATLGATGASAAAGTDPQEVGGTGDFLFEPSKKGLLDTLVPMYVDVEIYRALLESVASEHGARMTAMESATNNASDMIDRLTLVFNRARQAAITTELMEIIGGAEALKG
jgi:F-type H+-transporting ATPase subunit gamma